MFQCVSSFPLQILLVKSIFTYTCGSNEDQDLYRISARRAEAKRSYADIDLDRSESACRMRRDFIHRICGRPEKSH